MTRTRTMMMRFCRFMTSLLLKYSCFRILQLSALYRYVVCYT